MNVSIALRAGVAPAAAVCLTITLVCYAEPHLLTAIESRWAVPLFLSVFAARVLLGALFFLHPLRPSSTRTVKAFFRRDSCLSERLKVEHPNGLAALGGMLFGFAAATGVLLVLAIIAAVAKPEALPPLVDSFVLVTLASITFRMIGSGILIVSAAARLCTHRRQ